VFNWNYFLWVFDIFLRVWLTDAEKRDNIIAMLIWIFGAGGESLKRVN
jgi:hypothetical protein